MRYPYFTGNTKISSDVDFQTAMGMTDNLKLMRSRIEDSIKTKQAFLADQALIGQLESLSQASLESLRRGGKLIFAGNGGSFADAQHLTAEFIARFQMDRDPLPAVALGTNSSTLSAAANDYGFEYVFARELRAMARPEDVVIAISTSGNSPNILALAEQASSLELRLCGWTGRTGGKLAERCECLKVPSDNTARIQECHILMGHVLCELIEANYFDG